MERIKSHLAQLETDLDANHCKMIGNFKLVIFVLLIFLLQQLIEFYILSDLGKNYSDLCRLDCVWYKSIIDRGYDSPEVDTLKAKNYAFFPLLPLLASIFSTGSTLSLIITSKIFFFLAIFAFIKFCKKFIPEISILVTGSVVTFNPYAIYANSGYTESLFLFFTCRCFYLMKQKRYLFFGVSGAFLSATRLVGISMALSYVIFTLKELLSARYPQKIKIILAGLMLTFGLLAFMLFLHFHTGNFLIFIDSSKAWGRHISNPIPNILSTLKYNIFFAVILSLAEIGALSACTYLFATKRYELATFSLLCTMIPLSSGLLLSMPRYIWFQAPILLVLAKLINRVFYSGIPTFISIQVMIFFYYCWLDGLNFLI